MVRVMFVCLGNICRSVMAECIMTDIVKARGLNVVVDSSGTSNEEEGNPIYPPAKAELSKHGVNVKNHLAKQLRSGDALKFDLFIAMEERNARAMRRILGADAKIVRLLDFCDRPRDISDPYWTGDFETAYNEIRLGCERLADLIEQGELG